jgi:hypothetical protein
VETTTAQQLGRERFGADYALNAGEGNCQKCGKPTLYGRHIGFTVCDPCLRCVRIGLTPQFPCVHMTQEYREPDPDGWHPDLPELEVWT